MPWERHKSISDEEYKEIKAELFEKRKSIERYMKSIDLSAYKKLRSFNLKLGFKLLFFSRKSKTKRMGKQMDIMDFIETISKETVLLPGVPRALRRGLTRSQLKLLLAIMTAMQKHIDINISQHKRNIETAKMVNDRHRAKEIMEIAPDFKNLIDTTINNYLIKIKDAELKAKTNWINKEATRMKHNFIDAISKSKDVYRR